MTQATYRTALYNVINGVTDAGKVYDRERFVDDWSLFLDLFKTTIGGSAQIRGWIITYAGFDAEQNDICDIIRQHTFIARGFLRFDDSAESEKTAAAWAESVCNAIDDDSTLRGYLDPQPAVLNVFETRVFGDTLCHYAEITVTITEEYGL